MSTNYYLHRTPDPCPECKQPRRKLKVHVGKSSGGWVFLWRGYKNGGSPAEHELTGPDEWFAFLAEEIQRGSWIKTEYADEVSLEDFTKKVKGLRGGESRDDAFYRHAGGDNLIFQDFC